MPRIKSPSMFQLRLFLELKQIILLAKALTMNGQPIQHNLHPRSTYLNPYQCLPLTLTSLVKSVPLG